MGKVVFFDIDGTLVTPKNQIPNSTKMAMKELKRKGHLPVIATGRPPAMLEPIAKELEIESYIALNGQHIVIEGEVIYSNYLSADILEQLITTSYENGDRTFLLTEDKVIGNTFVDELMDPDFLTYVYKNLGDLSPEVVLTLFKHMTEKPLSRAKYEEENVLAAFVNTEAEKDKIYQNEFSNLHFTRATPFFSEVTTKGSHKATGMKKIVEYLGLKTEDTFAFGDSLNDLEMLKATEIGIAMGNAWPELKEIADYVTAHVEEDGIYNGLNDFDLI